MNVPLHEWQYEGSFVPFRKLFGEEKYSIVSDYLGTPSHAYDEKGGLVWERELDVYGSLRKGDNSFVPFLYQGQYVDIETGLAYNRFRYYDPESGNFISKDPIGLQGGLSPYSYVNDVNCFVDCLGLFPWEEGTPKPKGWRLPKNDIWSREAGHSNFTPNNPTSIGLKPRTTIPFKKGVPDFSGIQVREAIKVTGLTGNHTIDKQLTAKTLAEDFPNEFRNSTAALRWMRENNITPHHFLDDYIQFVPTLSHGGIRHSGPAHEMRANRH
ncbi:hypothetical protein GNY06_04760 [Elizabethkingia argentiflava]|uniref:Teneurin-like YD-shell domain-containing protein n=1 Tax=Elizabethkingia argenteiflava TaxID=2681556 RepID=A0A845PSB2_9FLAO|nr:RHS repeat-associated core domain-containing protein [Elizabethkingia argenteiflava]NAW50724.1 hypothetical protein [Elizabethkingia argenteiflava]